MTFAMIVVVVVVGGVLLTANFFAWTLGPNEGWLAYAATMR